MGSKLDRSFYGENVTTLRAFINRRIFGTKTEDVTGRWRKPHNDELHNS